MHEFLVTTEWLQQNLENPNIRIFDCTTILRPDPERTYTVEPGRDAYDQGHVPGAGFLDLQGDFSVQDPKLRFTFPSGEQFSKAAATSGISNDSHVILYTTTNPMWATRFWWMFRAFGHTSVSLLDGGYDKWQTESRPVSQDGASYSTGTFSATLDPTKVVGKDSVLSAIEEPGTCVLNSLGRDQFKGEGGHYGRPGRIKNSENIPWSELLDEDGCFLPEAQLRAKLAESRALEADRVITYCGGGIAATVDLFALAMLGLEDKVAVYDGSLSEWVQDESLPMETG